MRLQATITAAEMRPSGEMMITFEVAGRAAFTAFQIADGPAQKVGRGQEALSALYHAAGMKGSITDSAQFVGKSLSVSVQEVKTKKNTTTLVVVDW